MCVLKIKIKGRYTLKSFKCGGGKKMNLIVPSIFNLSCYLVRPTDSNISPAISIHEIGAVGATKTERTGIMQLKSEIKQVRYYLGDLLRN